MIFLRILRAILIVAGLAVIGLALMFGLEREDKGTPLYGGWVCDPSSSGTQGRVECGSDDLKVHISEDIPMIGLTGLGLICAAIALGQFDRQPAAPRRPAGGPVPTGPAPAGGPAPSSGPIPQQQQWNNDPRGY